jgi:CHAD domain-containing protein
MAESTPLILHFPSRSVTSPRSDYLHVGAAVATRNRIVTGRSQVSSEEYRQMAMRSTVEHEQKLEAPAGWELPDLGGEPLEPRIFSSVYHDTPDHSLARSGITLRRRTERGKSVWQLKLPVDGARRELEEPGGPVPPEALRTLLRAHERHARVAPVAELRTRRYGRLLTSERGTAEVTLDEVKIMDAQRVVSEFSEIEVELRDGEPRAVREIAKQLERSGATLADLTPKLFRALALVRAEPAQTPFETFRSRLREQLEAILANDPGVRLGGDDENVHQMRVATRRARALLRAAEPLYVGEVEPLSLELRWLAGVLGDVRDLDVLIARLHGEANELPATDARAADRLLRKLERNRSRVRRILLKALDGQRYADLLDRFEETIGVLQPSASEVTLDELAKKELKKLRREAKALADDAPDEQLHELRKRGKRVRYAYELAGATKVVKAAKVFQDVLGDHQDSVVAEERLRALASDAPTDQALAAGMLIVSEQRRRTAARESWRDAWKALDRA